MREDLDVPSAYQDGFESDADKKVSIIGSHWKGC